jgi:hypothetical protein
VIRRRQLTIAVTVVAAGLAVLLAAGRAPALDAGRDRHRATFVVTPPSPVDGLSARQYGVWVDANDRFTLAAHAFHKALGGCRMRLGSFQACALPSVTSMAYEERNAAAVAAIYQHHPGTCGRALRAYRTNIAHYMTAAKAFAHLPHGNPMSALNHLEGVLQESDASWNHAALRVRGECRAG